MVVSHAGSGLEPGFHTIELDDRVNIKAVVIFTSPGRNLCKSCIHQQFFTTDADVGKGETFTLIGGIRKQRTGPHIEVDDDTQILHLHELSSTGFASMIELCAGIGAAGKGFEYCGTQTQVYVDSNHAFASWLRRKTDKPVVEGDITDPRVMVERPIVHSHFRIWCLQV